MDTIINTYVDVCNQALELNKHRFPFKQILGAAKQYENGKNIEINVVDGDKIESYVFSIRDSSIIARQHEDCGDCNCVRRWKIERHYLEAISRNAPIYVQNPAKINWEWLYDMSI